MSDIDAAFEPTPSSPPLARQGPYGPIPDSARLTWGLATPFVQGGVYIVSHVPAVLFVLVVVFAMAVSGGLSLADIDPQAPPPELMAVALLAFIATQFPAWALLIAGWVKGFERRALATAGFGGANRLGGYGAGLLVGVGVALLMTAAAALVAPAQSEELAGLDASVLARPAWIGFLVLLVVLFLVQSFCEEVAFRGWMMSALAARWGVPVGVAGNALTFGLMHAQHFSAGWAPAVAAVTALTMVGVFLSLWALRGGSLWGVGGVHGGFNATLIVMTMAAAGAQAPDTPPLVVIGDTLLEALGGASADTLPVLIAQAAMFAALSGVVAALMAARRRAAAR